jgi:hypothetical protein
MRDPFLQVMLWAVQAERNNCLRSSPFCIDLVHKGVIVQTGAQSLLGFSVFFEFSIKRGLMVEKFSRYILTIGVPKSVKLLSRVEEKAHRSAVRYWIEATICA